MIRQEGLYGHTGKTGISGMFPDRNRAGKAGFSAVSAGKRDICRMAPAVSIEG